MGEMRVMDRSGDIVIQWDVLDGQATEKAKKEWDALKGTGFEFFLPAQGNTPPKRIKRWNPDHGLVIAAPGVKKPAERKTADVRSEAMAGGPSEAQRGDELTRR